MADQVLPSRALKDSEALCSFGCGCIVEKVDGDCGMCCPEAVSLRTARVAPLHEAAKAKSHAETEAWVSRQAPEVYAAWKERNAPAKGKK